MRLKYRGCIFFDFWVERAIPKADQNVPGRADPIFQRFDFGLKTETGTNKRSDSHDNSPWTAVSV